MTVAPFTPEQAAKLRDDMLALAEELAYKGDLTPWQEGGGPDMYEAGLDDASARIRTTVAAVLAADPEPDDAVIERMARAMAESKGILWNSLAEQIGTCDWYRRLAAAALDASRGGAQ